MYRSSRPPKKDPLAVKCHVCGKDTFQSVDRRHGPRAAATPIFYCQSCQTDWELARAEWFRNFLTFLFSIAGGAGVWYLTDWYYGIPVFLVLVLALPYLIAVLAGGKIRTPGQARK